MNENQKLICGVVVKSHPKSHIDVFKDYDDIFDFPPTYDDEAVVVLQVAPASNNQFIVEFVLKDDYYGDLKDQI